MNLNLIYLPERVSPFLSAVKAQIKQAVKKVYLSFQPYDGLTFSPTRGPVQCSDAKSVALAAGGSHITVREQDQRTFRLPQTVNSSLSGFFSQFAQTDYPPISISEIPGGHVYFDGAVLCPDGTTLARDLSLDFTSPANSHHLCGRLVHKSKILEGRTLSVASWRTQSYFHWLLDELPRYLVPHIPPFENIVCSRDTEINREALRLLGLDHKNISFINQAKHFECSSLIVPSYVAPTGHPSSYQVELLKRAIEPLITSSSIYPEKIFVSRKSARSRNIVNEDAVFSFFESQRYTRIKLEDLSWQDQINIFYHAREIFSPHGAGLANLVFCANKPLVIEVFNARYMHWCFWKLAVLVGAHYVPIAFPSMDEVEHNIAAGNLNINMGKPDIYAPIYLELKS
jgi:hypothetical protein